MSEKPNTKYGKAALASMYEHGQGILSPMRFGEKRRSFQMFGFAIGAFLPVLVAKYFYFQIEGGTAYIVLSLALITALLGAVLMTSIFNANFVRDETLQDPLFPPR